VWEAEIGRIAVSAQAKEVCETPSYRKKNTEKGVKHLSSHLLQEV
jgi:hypothetical protein